MESKKSGRILLRVCLFFIAGLFLGLKIGGILRDPTGFRVFLGRFRGGWPLDFGKTFFKEYKYIISLWITVFFLKKESLAAEILILKGFFAGTALRIIAETAGISSIFVYVLPLQVFSWAALILTAYAHIYNLERKLNANSVFMLAVQGVFLIFLGVSAEFVILKII